MTRSSLGVRRDLRPDRLRCAVLASCLAASLPLAGCGGSDPGEAGPDGQSTAGGAIVSGQWPLTGLAAKGTAPKYPVMVVKIDNTSSSSPQIGLGTADLVTEELVEGGLTRLAVFYHSQVPQKVGPVRSFRATDIGIVSPADAVLVASGGAPPTVRRVREAGIRTFTEGAPGYYRDSGRTSPYDLFMNLADLAKKVKTQGFPDNYFPWGSADDFPSGQPATGLAAHFSAAHTTSWQYRSGRYVNLNSVAAVADRFEPRTVLVLRVKVGDAGYTDPAGNPVPETRFTGKGQALVFHGGKLVRGTWRKGGAGAQLTLSNRAGELMLPPGRVWMELVPTDGGSVTITR